MLEVISIRHLPTRLNHNGILQGRIDEDIAMLTPELSAIVSKNRKLLTALGPFDQKLTSTLRRTISTAQTYGFPEAIKESLLDELNFGIYEGKHKREMEAALEYEWYNEPQHLVLGESLSELEKRVRTFIEVYGKYSKVLVFGHGAWIRAMLSLAAHNNISVMNKMVVPNNTLRITQFP